MWCDWHWQTRINLFEPQCIQVTDSAFHSSVDILRPCWNAELWMARGQIGMMRTAAVHLTEGWAENTVVNVSRVSNATRPAKTADASHPPTVDSDSMCD